VKETDEEEEEERDEDVVDMKKQKTKKDFLIYEKLAFTIHTLVLFIVTHPLYYITSSYNTFFSLFLGFLS